MTEASAGYGRETDLSLDESPSRLHQVIYDHNMTPFWVPLLELNNPLVSISQLRTYNLVTYIQPLLVNCLLRLVNMRG